MTPRSRFLFISISIILFALWIRVTTLYSLPVFIDEGNHLFWAQQLSIGNAIYPVFMDGKFLMGVLLALFNILGPDPLWVARAATVLMSIPTCAACIGIAHQLTGSRKAALATGFLYALMPFSVFYERQVLADPIMSAFGTTSMMLALMMAKRGAWRLVPVLAFTLGGAFLSKFFGGLYWSFPFFAVWILKTRRTILIQSLVSVSLAFLFTTIFIFLFNPLLGNDDGNLKDQQIGYVRCPPALCNGDGSQQISNFVESIRSLNDFIPTNLGWTTILLATLAYLITQKRSIAVLSLHAIFMLGVFILMSSYIPSRYLAFIVPSIVVLAGCSLATLLNPKRTMFTMALVIIALGIPLSNSLIIALKPEQAQFAPQDQEMMRSFVFDIALRDATFTVRQLETNKTVPPIVIAANTHTHSTGAYFDRTLVDVRTSSEVFISDIAHWLFNKQHIYIFDEVTPNFSPKKDSITELLTVEINRYPRLDNQSAIRLRQVTGVDDQLRQKIFEEIFPKPAQLTEYYKEVAANVSPTHDTAVIVYPPNHARAIDKKYVYGVGDSWPLDVKATEDELIRIAQQHTHVTAVLLQETRGDPQKNIEVWLNTNLFRLHEKFFGPVRVIEYAGKESVKESYKIDARFGDGIRLESVEVFDSVARRGEVLRLRLVWKAENVVERDLKSFTHIFIGDKIVAQRDGQPVGELRPTTTWKAGETIRDQFAILIPKDAPSGVYQLRIGLYDLTTLDRLAVNGGEFVVIGEITIK